MEKCHENFLSTSSQANHPTEREDYHWLRVTADNGTSFQVELDAWPCFLGMGT